MALFGGLGKKLGLPKGEDVFGDSDIVPLLAAAAGFYFAPALGMSAAMGAAGGAGLGSLAQGRTVGESLSNAALAYGVGSLATPAMTSSMQMTAPAGYQSQSALNSAIYGDASTTLATQGIASAPPVNTSAVGNTTITDTAGAIGDTAGATASDLATATAEPSMFDKIVSSAVDDPLMALSVGSTALGALGLLGEQEQEVGPVRPDAAGRSYPITYKNVRYDLSDPNQAEAYRLAKTETQKPGFQYDLSTVYAKHGGAMYEHGIEHPAEQGDYTGEVAGAGTGTSDSVPAWLSDGEFVLTAKAVKGAGGGDRDIGAARMYDMMAELEATA